MKSSKMFILCFSILILLFLPVSADAGKPILKQGVSDASVLELKKQLSTLGYLDRSNLNNTFDYKTVKALEKFQKEYNLKADGIAREDTFHILKIALKQYDIAKNGKPQDDKNVMVSDRGALRRMTAFASKYKGIRYVSGGSSPKGFDCSGFTQFVYRQFGLKIERTPGDQFSQGKAVAKKNLQPGDLVFFRKNKSNSSRIQHVGIYIGNNKFIHASSTLHKVVVANFSQYCSWSNYAGARRFTIK